MSAIVDGPSLLLLLLLPSPSPHDTVPSLALLAALARRRASLEMLDGRGSSEVALLSEEDVLASFPGLLEPEGPGARKTGSCAYDRDWVFADGVRRELFDPNVRQMFELGSRAQGVQQNAASGHLFMECGDIWVRGECEHGGCGGTFSVDARKGCRLMEFHGIRFSTEW